MKRLIFLILAAVGLMAVACNKGLLDKKPLEAVSDKDAFASAENALLFVNNIYASLPNGFERGWYMLDAGTSDAENSYAWTDSHLFNNGLLTPTTIPNGDWSLDFKAIRNCNVFLESIETVTNNPELVSRMKGEVHFLRAFYYAELQKRYGAVPLITTVLTLDDDFSQERASSDAVVDFIAQELDAAAAALPAKYDDPDVGRATKVAALSLKGRVLLYAGKFAESATATKAAIDLAEAEGYGLFSPYYKIFLENNNKEIIFDKQLLAKNNSGYVDMFNNPVGYGGWGGTCPTQNFVDAYEMQATGKPITDAASGYNANDPYVGRDPRFAQSVQYNGSMWKGREIDTKENGRDKPDGNGDATKTGYYMRKFLDEAIPEPYDISGAQHWVLIRLGEVYLNYAEALLKQSKPAEAVVYVNKIRERAEMPALTAAQLTWERYMNERRVELAFEEHRFWDVRRWKVAMVTENEPVYGMKIEDVGGTLKYTRYKWEDRVFRDKDYLFPIPQGEREKNANLTQNPGY